MALGTPVVAATAYSASAGTSVAPAYPTGITAGDCLVMFVGQKPSTANGGTVTTPTGWTLQDSLTGAGGYGTTLGADTGNTNLYVYTKNTVTGAETGTLSVTLGGNGVSWAFIIRVPDSGGTLSYGTADGQRTTTPTSPMSIALTNGASPTNFQTGDLALWAMCIPTDVTTPSQFSAESITATGATFGAAVELNEPDSTTGNDIGGYSAYAFVTAGSSTTAPTVTTTLAGTRTNVRGPVVLLRIHETLPARTGSMDATEDASDTFAATGGVLVEGSGAATETGTDALSATGLVGAAIIIGSFAASETGSDTLTSTGKVIAKGTFAATETGSDSASATGKVIVKGSLAITESGADTLAASGKVYVKGAGAATETTADTLAASGKVAVKGTFAATETGTDTLAATGKVIVKGAFNRTETGTDTASATGKVLVKGSLAVTEQGTDVFVSSGGAVSAGVFQATETGNDTLAASGKVIVKASIALTETGTDTLAATGKLLVQGAANVTETGTDTLDATGTDEIIGSMVAVEADHDTLAASGTVVNAETVGTFDATESGTDTLSASGYEQTTGTFAATELPDTFGGYVAPGYIEPGYVAGVNGTIGATFEITGAQALLIRRLHQLHGLAGQLVVGRDSRQAGDLVQSITESGETVTIKTTDGNTTLSGDIGQMIEELAALHGLTADLVVKDTERRAGSIVQSIIQTNGVTTVARTS